MVVSTRTYEQLALEDPEGEWEMHDGRLVSKRSAMTARHNDVMNELGFRLHGQLKPHEYRVRVNSSRARRSADHYYIPDVCVVLSALVRELIDRPVLEVYTSPLPLVVEVWSPSTGDYDVDTKLPEYQRRSDLEIWRIHPFERALTRWVRQPDGSYTSETITHGLVELAALPSVVIDFDALFPSWVTPQ